FCPSDRGSPAYWMGDPYYRTRANYVVCYGANTRPWTALAAGAVRAPRGIFGLTNDSVASPQRTKIVQITDGSSNTLLMSEIIMAKTDGINAGSANWDIRGDIINDDGCFVSHNFMTVNTPNGGTDIN